ncbi:hypothetical protein THAOC_28678, partial [Thalassiosira oceanica]
DGQSWTPVVGLGGEPGEGTRSRRGGWDSGDDVRRPERRRHDSSDEDDDGSDSVDATTSSGHGSGLKNAGNFAVAERKPRKNGGDGRTVYRDKSGRRREVDPAADETERPGLRGRRRRGRYGRTRVRGRGTSRHSSSRPIPPRQSRGGINDQYLEAPKKAGEICPMAAHAWRRQEEESAGTDGAPCWKHARRRGDSEESEWRGDPYDIFETVECTLSPRVLAHQYAVSHHICVGQCAASISAFATLSLLMLLLRRALDCMDHLAAALEYRRRGEPSSSPPETACQFAPFSTRTKTSGRSKGPNGLSIHRPRPTQMGSGFGLLYPSSYGVASPRALYRVETGGPMGDVEFEM